MKLLQHSKIDIEYIEDKEVEIDFNRGEIEGPSERKKDQEEKIKKMIQESISFHESMARTFYEAKLKKDGMISFPSSNEDS